MSEHPKQFQFCETCEHAQRQTLNIYFCKKKFMEVYRFEKCPSYNSNGNYCEPKNESEVSE